MGADAGPEGYDRPMSDEPESDTPGRRSRAGLIGTIAVAAGVVAVLVLLAVGLVNRDVSTEIRDALAAGERPAAPDLELPILTPGGGLAPAGTPVSLDDLRGRPVVLNFWASWCEPCKDESPLLEAIWQRYRTRGVMVIGVDVQDLSDDATEFVADLALTYPSLYDGPGDTQDRFGVTGVPETFVIDRQGRVAAYVRGPVERAEQITVPLEQLL